ncbi:hypothetical protein ACFQ4D_15310 [Oceanobacillus profundus]
MFIDGRETLTFNTFCERPLNMKGRLTMYIHTPLDYNEKFEEQLLTREELDKVKAKSFINLMSELFLKYEPQIEETLLQDKEEIISA